MKKVYFSLLILFIVLLFVSPVIFAEPNIDLNVLLYSEDKEDTATHLRLYASDEIASNKRIIYSIVITASVPSPLGQGNVIDQGLVALVVPETAEVDYQNIKVYGAPTPDSNRYVEYLPESESTKEWFNILGSIVSKIPFLGLVMDLTPIYQARPGDYGEFIDLNQFDIVKVNWEVPRLKYCQKVQIDISVHLGDDAEIGLYAYWQSRASSSDGTGPTYARDNIVDVGFNISDEIQKKEVVLRVGKIRWDRTYGGLDDDGANSIIQTFDGGYAVAGYTASKGAGREDFWIIKLDNQGNKVWDRTYGGNAGDWAESLIQNTDGAYVIAGDTISKGAGGRDIWVIKLDIDGYMGLDKAYGGYWGEGTQSIVQTTDGGYAIAGRTNSKGSGNKDCWVIKLDKNGNIQWDQTYGGSAYDNAHSIIQTIDGGYAVAGETYSKSSGREDAWLFKLDGQGNKIWDKTFGGSYSDEAYSLIQTSDGGYAVAGYTKSKGAGGTDAWVIKLDKNGNIIKYKVIGGSNNDEVNSIIQTSDGGYAVAGFSESYGAGKKDVWVIKLDKNVNIEWNQTYGGSNDDEGNSIIQTSDGGYIVAGSTSSKGSGESDAWIIKLDEKGNL